MNNKTNFYKFISEFKIEIPRIQRDYVQGRAITSEQIERRGDFVNNMISSLKDENKTCVLDFVYGFTSDDIGSKTFIPLDGQQRLTSLYLLHWYFLFLLRKKERLSLTKVDVYDKENKKMSLLNGRFCYNNRISSTEFCKRLTSIEFGVFNFDVEGTIKAVILGQAWFDDEWMSDPTIETMMEMLLVFEEKLCDESYTELKTMAERLFNEDAIYFDKLNLEELRQGESLYVKMNARGKKLTQFENWKSKFTKMLEDCHKKETFDCGDFSRCGSLIYKDYFCYSIEHNWNDIFWHFVSKGKTWNTIEDVMNSQYPTVDRAFSNFLKFIHAICYFIDKNDKKAKVLDFQWTIAQNEESFGKGKEDNLKFLFQCLDFLSCMSIDELEQFFKDIFYIKENNTDDVPNHKVRHYKEQTNLFELAIGYYQETNSKEMVNNRDDSNKFDLNSTYLLWAILKYCAPIYCNSRNTPFPVDDNLRNYVRECRNNIEEIDQFLTGPVTLSPNIRITDAHDNLGKLPRTDISIKYNNSTLQDLYEWLGDFDYVGGQALAFVPILDEINSGKTTITPIMIKNFMCCFDKTSTMQRVQMIIGAGYKGKTKIGITGNRERIFFGNISRWKVLFVEDSDEFCKILRKLIIDFNTHGTIPELLKYYKESCAKNTFAYYMLYYKYALWAPNNPSADLIDSKNGEYYYAVLGDLDDMDLIALRSLSSNPLSAYHIDPLVCAVVHDCLSKYPDIADKIKFIGRYGTKQGIAIPDASNTEIDAFRLVSNKDGWTIEDDNKDLLPKDWLNDFLQINPQLSYKDNIFELTIDNVKETDKVIIGKTILEAIATHFNW